MTATSMRGWEQRFEPGILDRMRARYGTEVDVEALAKDCADFAARKPVANINGLLVSRVRAAASRATRNEPMSKAAQLEEADRTAAFAVQLYQVISEGGLMPNHIADYLDAAVSKGLRINTRVVDRLRTMGNRWPGR